MPASCSVGSSLTADAALRKARTLYVSAPLRSSRYAIFSSADFGSIWLRALGATRRDSRRFIGLLGVLGWPRCVEEPVRAVLCRHVQQRLERLRSVADACPGVAAVADKLRNCSDRQALGIDRVDVVPGERGGHLSPDARSSKPRAKDRLVRSVLIEVDEDLFSPLFFPPVRGDQLRVSSFELSCERHRTRTDLVTRPASFKPDVDMDTPIAGGLRVTRHAQFG